MVENVKISPLLKNVWSNLLWVSAELLEKQCSLAVDSKGSVLFCVFYVKDLKIIVDEKNEPTRLWNCKIREYHTELLS